MSWRSGLHSLARRSAPWARVFASSGFVYARRQVVDGSTCWVPIPRESRSHSSDFSLARRSDEAFLATCMEWSSIAMAGSMRTELTRLKIAMSHAREAWRLHRDWRGCPEFRGTWDILRGDHRRLRGLFGLWHAGGEHGRTRAAVRDLPIAGRPAVLVFARRRWRCPEPACTTHGAQPGPDPGSAAASLPNPAKLSSVTIVRP